MQKNIAQQIADWLVQQGVAQVFCVTGGGAMFLNQALGNHPQLRCTFMHHEQACAMAAEGYARIAGRPAVVMLTTGPGAINALNGVYGAFTDSIPMLVLSGQVKRETCRDFFDLPELRQLGDQEGPTISMASPVCKLAKLVRQPKDLERLLPAAWQAAVSGRPGPAWLDIPLDIQSATEPLSLTATGIQASPPGTQLTQDCAALIARLKTANRPLILGGTGVRLAGVVDEVLALAEATGIPMATAWTHDLIASDHPLFAGRPGTIGTRAGNFCLQNADLVLVLGSRLNIRQTSYNFASFARNAWVAQVDVDAAEFHKPTYSPDLAITSDLRVFLQEFNSQRAKTTFPSYQRWATWCRDTVQRYAAIEDHAPQTEGGHTQALNPYVMVDRVFRQLRDNDIVACGNASACILPFQVGVLKKNQRLFSNSGSASMGYDLPAAIGAAMAAKAEKRRVICFAGDGSLQMNIQELQTLKTTGANVIVIVINNKGYLSIWQTHENFFGKVIGATPASGVEFPDFVAVAKAYGLRAESVSGSNGLDKLDQLLQEDGPMLIDVHVDPRQEFVPRIKSRVDEHGKFITPELDDMHPFLEAETIQSIRKSAEAISSEKAKS